MRPILWLYREQHRRWGKSHIFLQPVQSYSMLIFKIKLVLTESLLGMFIVSWNTYCLHFPRPSIFTHESTSELFYAVLRVLIKFVDAFQLCLKSDRKLTLQVNYSLSFIISSAKLPI
jgi:hypothetical protein